MSAATRMTMSATIQRNNATIDDYNNPGPPVWQIIGKDVDCYVWEKSGSTITDNGKIIKVNLPAGIFPLDADIKKGDRVLEVKDRLGVTLFNMLYIDTILRHRDHLALELRHAE
jgi:hypothetical protein